MSAREVELEVGSIEMAHGGARWQEGGRQNYGPFLGTLNIRCRIIIGDPKGTIILTTTHITHYSSFHLLFHYPPYNPNITLV